MLLQVVRNTLVKGFHKLMLYFALKLLKNMCNFIFI